MGSASKKFLLPLLLLGLILQSCEEKTAVSKKVRINPIEGAAAISPKELKDCASALPNQLPKKGSKAEDFISEPAVYAIQHKAEGDLNNDGLADIVIVQKEKEQNTGVRIISVLLQNEDKTYRLDKTSATAMPSEYTDIMYETLNKEPLEIKDNELIVKLFGTGIYGNIFSYFKYFGNEFLLTKVETFNMGAGGQQELRYDLIKGELAKEDTNTMEDEMPSTTTIFKVKKEKHLFESASPENIIQEAYQKVADR